MIFLISLAMPIIAAIAVFAMFYYDLKHAKGLRKLKRGAVENLINRHRIVAIVHLGIFLLMLPFFIILFGTVGIVVAVIWAIVFFGHMTALSRFSRQMIATMQMNSDINQRLSQLQAKEGVIEIDEEGELIERR